jgi:hypothetical protein
MTINIRREEKNRIAGAQTMANDVKLLRVPLNLRSNKLECFIPTKIYNLV